MQTLILPGYSSENKSWVDDVAKNLKINGIIRPFYWMHWTDENNIFEVNKKALLIAKHLKGDKFNIIAKSIGTLVASLICNMIPDNIEKVIFCGIPLADINSDELEIIKSVIFRFNTKFVGFQNKLDPHGTFDEVRGFGNIIMTDRTDHSYPFFEKFDKFLS